MTPELIALGRRAVACNGWRWMAGMRSLEGALVVSVGLDGVPTEWAVEAEPDSVQRVVSAHGRPGYRLEVWASQIPDLSDPATLGCLLALVREATGGEVDCAREDPSVNGVWYALHRKWYDSVATKGCSSEPEALVAALEAAP